MTQHGTIIYLEGVSVTFDGFKALRGVNLYVDHGELRALIGPNGAGKTTLLDVICGKVKPDNGRVIFGETTELTHTGAAPNHGAGDRAKISDARRCSNI